ncbi:hypothetical protein ACNKHT_11310 [Shigella flexneri]
MSDATTGRTRPKGFLMHNRQFLANISSNVGGSDLPFLYRFATNATLAPSSTARATFCSTLSSAAALINGPHRNVVAFSGVTKLNRLHRFTQPN